MRREWQAWVLVLAVASVGFLETSCYLFEPAFSGETRAVVIEALEDRRRELAAAYSRGAITTEEYERELARIGDTLFDLDEDRSRADWGMIALEVGGWLTGTGAVAGLLSRRARKQAVAEVEEKPSRASAALAALQLEVEKLKQGGGAG